MTTPSNVHPTDALAALRARIRTLQDEEAQLRRHLIDHPEDRSGKHYIAQLKTFERTTVDIERLRAFFGDELDRFIRKANVTQVQLEPRRQGEDERPAA